MEKNGIAAPFDVDTVYISNRKFVPVSNKFYEVLVASGNPLLLEFTYTIKEPGASIGYGSTTTTTAATPLTSFAGKAGAYNLTLPDNFKVIPGYRYWLRKDGKWEKANNIKSLIKAYPDKRE